MESLAARDCLVILMYVSVDPGLDQLLFVRLDESYVDVYNDRRILIIIFFLERLPFFFPLFLGTRINGVKSVF
jgi:hypothetical protein